MEKKQKEIIFLGVPILKGQQSEEIATLREMCQKLNHDPLHPFHYISDTVNDKSGVEYARNLLCDKFLKSPANRLWFWDYDVTVPPNWLDLLYVEGDIVGGMYPMQRRTEQNELGIMFPALFRNKDDTYRMYTPADRNGNGDSPIIEVDATGMGMTIIRREVLEDPAMRLGDDSDCDSPAIFDTPRALNGKLLATEDIDFCERAKGHGYSVFVKLDVVGDHRHLMNLGLVWQSMEKAFQMGIKHGSTQHVPARSA